MSKAELEWLDKVSEREQKLADLKADLEMPSYEELQELQEKVEFIRVKHNELVNWLTQLFPDGDDRAYMLQFLKVRSQNR